MESTEKAMHIIQMDRSREYFLVFFYRRARRAFVIYKLTKFSPLFIELLHYCWVMEMELADRLEDQFSHLKYWKRNIGNIRYQAAKLPNKENRQAYVKKRTLTMFMAAWRSCHSGVWSSSRSFVLFFLSSSLLADWTRRSLVIVLRVVMTSGR